VSQLNPEQSGRKQRSAAIAALCLSLGLSWLVWTASGNALPRGRKAEQRHDGLIFGTVWDPSGRPVYGVRVKIRRASEKKARWELYSNHLGEFEQLLPAGKYVLWADIRPKKAQKHDQSNPWAPPQVTVQVENDVRVDIGLHLKE
jgi:hypothetical protein